jgi:hypothetical protein
MSYTYVTLSVSQQTFNEIKTKLKAGGYSHAFDGDYIDMHGIAIFAEEEKPHTLRIAKDESTRPE